MTSQLALFAMQQRAKARAPIPQWTEYTAVMRRKCFDCVRERHAGQETHTCRDARRRNTVTGEYYCYSHAIDRGDTRT